MSIAALDLRIGGCDPRREIKYDDQFEMAVYYALGPKMLRDSGFCADVWAALTNVIWTGSQGRILYSFRSAGDLIAALLSDGDYTDWYCSARAGVVTDEISRLMKKRGWTHEPAPLESAA